jgi:hypothetical protein
MRVRLGPSKSPMHWGDLEVTVLLSRTIVLVPIKPRVLRRVILNREDDEGSHKCEGNTQSGLCDHASIGGVPRLRSG